MESNFDIQVKRLYEKSKKMIQTFSKANQNAAKYVITMPEEFQKEFYRLIDMVNLSLMEDTDNFYGYFLFQMGKEIRCDINSPTAVNFKGANYVIYFNPIIFLTLTMNQMESTIKHEILHILSMHLIRSKEMKNSYQPLVINMAMDIVVNKYLMHLPPYATTLEAVNAKYSLKLEPYQSFEYYAEKLHSTFPLLEADKAHENSNAKDSKLEDEFNAQKTHDIWDESVEIEEKTLQEFTEKIIKLSQKGELPTYLNNMISSLKNSKGELPWHLYLNRLMGSVESNKKKTITRRNRRQPDRLDLRGQLRSHKANVAVAIDISGSMSDEEFRQAMREVLSIVKNYNHEITIIECDDVIQHVYKVRSVKDVKDRINTRGGTKFNPVIEYANQNKVNLLIYFTDGKGEGKLKVAPKGYHILWVLTGKGEKLSLKESYGTVKKLSMLDIKDTYVDFSEAANGGYSMQYQERNV